MQTLSLNDLQIVEVDDEPRILDVRLAERLEFERSRVIRELIERNRGELERHGSLPCHTANPGPQGGRPGTEYWLNEAQALVICMRSDAPRAADVRAELIALYQMWRRGQVASRSPVTINMIGDLFDQKLQPVHRRIDGLQASVERVDGNIVHLKADLSQLKSRVDDNVPRRVFSENTRKQWRHIVSKFYNGRCPCCRDTQIVAGNTHADHFIGRERNGAHDGWLVCDSCNYKLVRDAQFKERAKSHFSVFQDNRSKEFGTHLKQSSRKCGTRVRKRAGKIIFDPGQRTLFDLM